MQKPTAVCSTWKRRSSSPERRLPCIHWSQGLSSGGGGGRRQPHSRGGLSGEEGRALLYLKLRPRTSPGDHQVLALGLLAGLENLIVK